MSLDEVIGSRYGPYPIRVSPEKVAEYVSATGDQPDRWQEHAPPSFAGALLFVAAPHFLEDLRVKPFTGVLVHVDQSFTWYGPLATGAPITVVGHVDKVRERGGRFFVTFSADVVDESGEKLLDAVATFLMAKGVADSQVDDLAEPAVWHRGLNETPSVRPLPGIGEDFDPMAKSASRIDLVKYAAASGDYNPIHFDHQAARTAGLSGIVVHGLLMAAWAMQAAAAVSDRPDPIAHMKLRFRNPLRPAAAATVTGRLKDVSADAADARLALAVTSAGEQLVTAQCVARLAE